MCCQFFSTRNFFLGFWGFGVIEKLENIFFFCNFLDFFDIFLRLFLNFLGIFFGVLGLMGKWDIGKIHEYVYGFGVNIHKCIRGRNHTYIYELWVNSYVYL